MWLAVSEQQMMAQDVFRAMGTVSTYHRRSIHTGNMHITPYTTTQTATHAKFVGMWKDQHDNLVVIRPGVQGTLTASFALGTTHAPFVRRCFRNAMTIDMPTEFRPAWEAFAIEFGRPYRGPDLLLAYGMSEETHEEYLEPSYVLIESATDEERECYRHITTVDDLWRVERTHWNELLAAYHLSDTTTE